MSRCFDKLTGYGIVQNVAIKPNMSESIPNISATVDHIFRHEYGKIVSVLVRRFGTSSIDLAEDVVQDAFYEAVKQWSFSGIPDNPSGWIYKVATYKALNFVSRQRRQKDHGSSLDDKFVLELDPEDVFSKKEIADDQLRMMFTCCNPAISVDSQIALTLKTLCGFSTAEIARAFLTSESNINKRLVRARQGIRKARVPFEVPTGDDLEIRLLSVLETIYLLFNEGYDAMITNRLVRYELCEEAIRLAKIIAINPIVGGASKVYALLALMTLNAARFKARIDDEGQLVSLEDQERGDWNHEMIVDGLRFLDFAASGNEVSSYHVLAAISAHHCTATSFDSTDWQGILGLYDQLAKLDSSPIIQLNRAVVLSKVAGVEEALRAIDQIEDQLTLKKYPHYYISKAELHFQARDHEKGRALLLQVLDLQLKDELERQIINKLAKYSASE